MKPIAWESLELNGCLPERVLVKLVVSNGGSNLKMQVKKLSQTTLTWINSLRPFRSLSGKVSEFGSVFEHVCQLLVAKVVHLEVIWEVSQGVLVT